MYLFTADETKLNIRHEIDNSVAERLRFCMGNSNKIVRRLDAEYPQVNTDVGRALIGDMSCKIVTYVDRILIDKYKCCAGGTSLLICASLLATLERTDLRYISIDFSTIINRKLQAITSRDEVDYNLTFIDLDEVSFVNRFTLLFNKPMFQVDVDRRIELMGYKDKLDEVAKNNSNSDFVRYYLATDLDVTRIVVLGIKNDGLLYHIVKEVIEPVSMNDYTIIYAMDNV